MLADEIKFISLLLKEKNFGKQLLLQDSQFRMHQSTFLENSTIIGCAGKTIPGSSEP